MEVTVPEWTDQIDDRLPYAAINTREGYFSSTSDLDLASRIILRCGLSCAPDSIGEHICERARGHLRRQVEFRRWRPDLHGILV